MSRAGAVAARVDLESEQSPHALLAFLTIEHPGLGDPLRFVSDVMDYLVGGLLFIGVPFGFRTLTDTDSAPRTQIVVENMDRRIGIALRQTNIRAKVRMDLRSSADFDLSQDPRAEVTSSAPIYAFRQFDLVNISVNATEMTGDVELIDFSVEPWPNIRATQDRLPGLYR